VGIPQGRLIKQHGNFNGWLPIKPKNVEIPETMSKTISRISKGS
jgi:hypothetical protein